MGDPYILMLIGLAILAIIDLVVGVSNDAVNFLNSAIGSKAIRVRNIMIIASVGVFFGAVTSSGMMEVARKGIFNPNMFMFQDIMFIFMAVMITDVLLLDIFNSLGMPTSTTVSIVFELLGAAVCISLLKISANDSQSFADIWNYINHEKAVEIIKGILLSVVVAFSVGAIVQFISRIIYTFNFAKRKTYISALFGGFAITAITYFIIIKGMKGTPWYADIKDSIEGNTLLIISGSFVAWSLISQFLISVFKINILKLIIGIGTFSLAMAFSGNDLVNFVGVPIAALNSYEAWKASGVSADAFSMGILAKKVPSNVWLLLVAGAIMVVTLWTSSKAQDVIKTGINLSRQGEGHEKFQPNPLSRIVVRIAMLINAGIRKVFPAKTIAFVDAKFQKPVIDLSKDKTYEMPAFDLVRAAVNLIVAGILISIATSMKLPLSTTYVTFMVAMGTSLADRAWGRESAVYRVAGVINVVGGWFLTAIIAFAAAGIIAYLISWSMVMIPVLLLVVILLITRNTLIHRKKSKEEKKQIHIERAELITINGVIEESADHIAGVASRVNKLYTNVVNDLAEHDLNKLRKTEKHVAKLNDEIDGLKDGVFYFIKSLDETSVQASRFYILVLGYLQDVAQSISYISKASFKHVNNNHKNLKKEQLTDLKHIDDTLSKLLDDISTTFENRSFEKLELIINEKKQLLKDVSTSIEKQVARIRTDETSPKNTTLYFSVLLETQDLVSALMSLLETYEEFHISSKNS
ncbi:inorganic phosphate transporter [Tenacibaculum finnmarkense genomovar finnmarkense]|uniref:Phosphate transporter n=1 Tax=Tenacibaculum finnmarkense genomovar finnmarkense TaxID=1458503 RepID=A0AAP1RHG7_9FLAO|nr:inorganic phosphate transporter [Tenacibaculum finnmarkense]MBE7653708.1 inorganic phosphate transporter [Tenacibaculum finnmarkense genomovar finnmarkense]MBE7660158.1 inorganic phosphate transporter [Tenacibaculum finnmarkense genomovar finnmarkense]MBE7692005.1 inorganic phosphate transporter [Tenacibaculum finnmarkense genomovar finnmarkense]MBE7696012.1 inorganic phosphate transporter [Tenacibaculum finnmarkense genomovar finnmarkense]MCD8402480.1 inorganic phosphate transporter [Tenac